MAQKTILRAKGLYTDPNQLSGVPDGALVVADNVIIDRDDAIEPRRGFSKYGEEFGSADDRTKQLLIYKERVLTHYDNTLLYDSDGAGTFEAFDGTYGEVTTDLRIRAQESNKNLYFTTDDGIKKISATSAADFTTASGFIVDAGIPRALDVTGVLNSNTNGFLTGNSETGYRVVWGKRDPNDNLLLGSPSSRLVITNFNTNSANVDLTFAIPDNITSDFFYQVYRTAVFTATGNLTLDDIDPGDEMQLVIEDFPSAAQLSAGIVEVTDIAPEDFRQGGLLLYTNPSSGDGIGQANEAPPKAHDLTMYQSTVFYANTESKARQDISLLSVTGLTSTTSSVSIDDGTTTRTYTFVGEKEITEVDFTSYSDTIPTDLDGKYFLLNSAGDKRKYYVWYDNTKTTQTIDFTNYNGDITVDLDGKYFILYTQDSDFTYYVWYDYTGSTVDPGTLPNSGLTGFSSIRVDISSDVTKADVAASTDSAITTGDINGDFDVSYTALDEFLTVDTESFEESRALTVETIQKGFSYTASTPTNSDPGNDTATYTDVAGRTGFRVNVSRGVTTTTHVADATAAAIVEQDAALDFDVDYTAGVDFEITTTNNGNTTDAADSGINGIGAGFSITVTQQGDGEDSALNHVLLSDAASPAQQIDETARSLVNIINKDTSGSVYAFYLSGASDLPGQILLESRDIGVNQFTVTASDATTGEQFNPALPPATGASAVMGEAEIKPNRIYFAKLQQPEAVPLLNFIDVGPEDKAISRILALRESLFILKEDGVYRLTGLDGNFSVDLFDESTKIIAPDSAVVLNNQIYCLTNQGVVVISDTGVSIISREIDNIIKIISSSNYNFRLTTFGVSYETDRAYLLWLPTSTEDDVATQAYRYSTTTNSWTRYDLAKTAGIVNPGNDKLYLGPNDENFVEEERKNFNRTDYADRDFDLIIPTDAVEDNTLKLSSSTNVDIGDAIVQTQYLTINEYNQLLSKLDLDPGTGAPESTTFDYSSYTGTIPDDLHSKYFFVYAASDAVRYVVFYDAQGDLPSLDPAVFSEIGDSEQIRVDISSGVTTKADVASATATAISTATFDFITTYVGVDEFFTTTTSRNGDTTDAFDSPANGLSNGFGITVTSQGVGDYFDTLEAVNGANLAERINSLALELDGDPGIIQSDFVSAVATYSGTGSTVVLGNPTTINETSHGLQTGRIVTITSSTSTPSIDGTYSITKVDDDNFTIDIETTVGGTCDWSAGLFTFQEIQGGYNTIVNKLNADTGAFYQNYLLSEETKDFEVLVIDKASNTTDVEMQFSTKFIEGPITVYKGISTNVVYTPETFGDTSVSKHVREGTFIFEDSNFSRGTVGYRTDLSPGFETIDFTKAGKGDWSLFAWSNHSWGGGFSGVPLRTYIPRQKQRCRYIQGQFIHDSAREQFVLFGASYTFRGISEKAYRGS